MMSAPQSANAVIPAAKPAWLMNADENIKSAPGATIASESKVSHVGFAAWN